MRSVLPFLVVIQIACTQSTPDAGASSSGGASDAAMPADAAMPSDAAMGRDVQLADTGPGCGTVPVQGICDGDILRFCDDGNLRETDCAMRMRRCDIQMQLGGNWCLGGVGQSCEVVDTDACEEHLSCVEQRCTGGLPDGGVDGGMPDPDGGADESDGGDVDAG